MLKKNGSVLPGFIPLAIPHIPQESTPLLIVAWDQEMAWFCLPVTLVIAALRKIAASVKQPIVIVPAFSFSRSFKYLCVNCLLPPILYCIGPLVLILPYCLPTSALYILVCYCNKCSISYVMVECSVVTWSWYTISIVKRGHLNLSLKRSILRLHSFKDWS